MTFRVIREKVVGSVTRRERWRLKFIARTSGWCEQVLDWLQEQGREEYESVLKRNKVDIGGPFRGARIDDNGELLAHYCDCVRCQSEVHGLSLEETVRGMEEAGLLTPDQASIARERLKAHVADKLDIH
jgi:hypothetical protein